MAPAAAARAPAVGYQLDRTYVPIAHVRHSLCHTEHSAFRRVFCDCRRYPLDRQVTAACATPRWVCDARRGIFFIDFLSKLSKGNVYRVRECNRRIAKTLVILSGRRSIVLETPSSWNRDLECVFYYSSDTNYWVCVIYVKNSIFAWILWHVVAYAHWDEFTLEVPIGITV